MNTNLNTTTKNTWYEDYLNEFEESLQKKKENIYKDGLIILMSTLTTMK